MSRRKFLKNMAKVTKGAFLGMSFPGIMGCLPKNMDPSSYVKHIRHILKIVRDNKNGKKYLQNPEKIMDTISNIDMLDYLTVDPERIKQVFLSRNFKNYLKNGPKMNIINIFSLAQAIVRRAEYKKVNFDNAMTKSEKSAEYLANFLEHLSKDVTLDSQTINEATLEVISGMEKMKKEKIIDRNTEVLALINNDFKGDGYDLNYICDQFHIKKNRRKIFQQTKSKNIPLDKSAVKKKIRLFLDSIIKSSGKTVVYLAGHGNNFKSDTILLGAVTNKDPSLQISRSDLGEAIIKSGNEENINLVIESCFGYNFAQNLRYQLKLKEAKMPNIVITTANKGHICLVNPSQRGNHSTFLSEMTKIAKKNLLQTQLQEKILLK